MSDQQDIGPIPIIHRSVNERFKHPHFGRKARNISIGLFFPSFFLGLVDIRLIFLSLVPWTVAGVLILINHYLGNWIHPGNPIILRDGHIEVDRYFSFWSAIKNDRFIPLGQVVSIEVLHFIETTYIQNGVDPEPKSEANAIIVLLKDGRAFSIYRHPWIINNFENQLNSWNEARSDHSNIRYAVQNEGMSQTEHFWNDSSSIIDVSRDESSRYVITLLLFISTFIVPIFMVVLLYSSVSESDPDDIGDTFISFLLAFSTVLLMVYAMFGLLSTLEKQPSPMRWYEIDIGKYGLIIRTYNRGTVTVLYEELRGICADPRPDYPNATVFDTIFGLKPGYGFLVIDECVLTVRAQVANAVQDKYHKLFGFYPQSYYYIVGGRGPPSTDYYALQSKPRGAWNRSKRS